MSVYTEINYVDLIHVSMMEKVIKLVMTTCACMTCVGVFSSSCLFSPPSEQEVCAPAVIPLVHRSQKHMRVYYCWMLRSGATSSMYCFLWRWMTQIIDQHTTKSLRANTSDAKVQDATCYISTSVVYNPKNKYVWLVNMESQPPRTATINWF